MGQRVSTQPAAPPAELTYRVGCNAVAPVCDAIVDAKRRGDRVRVIVDCKAGPYDDAVMERLSSAVGVHRLVLEC